RSVTPWSPPNSAGTPAGSMSARPAQPAHTDRRSGPGVSAGGRSLTWACCPPGRRAQTLRSRSRFVPEKLNLPRETTNKPAGGPPVRAGMYKHVQVQQGKGTHLMCKKLAIVAIGVAAGAVAYPKFGHKLNKKEASLEAQIQSQEQILAGLDDEITKNLRLIAERDVEADYLRKDIKDIETRQTENKKVLQAKRAAL